MKNHLSYCLILFSLVTTNMSSFNLEANSLASKWEKTENTSARLISASTALGSSELHRFGLQFKLKPNWKIYWRSPGDAGFPPSIDWSKSKNLANTVLKWPAPLRFSLSGIDTIGYKNQVVFPISIKTLSNTKELELAAKINYLACNKICIPYDAHLNLTIPPGEKVATKFSATINQYQNRVPKSDGLHGLSFGKINVIERDKNLEFSIDAQSERGFESPDIFLEGPAEYLFSKPKTRLGHNKHNATFTVLASKNDYIASKSLAKRKKALFTFTLVDNEASEEHFVNFSLPELKNTYEIRSDTIDERYSLFIILSFALFGGLILNFMPCVLPVLSIKLIGLIQKSGKNSHQFRFDFLASALGIISTFILIAIGLISAQSLGTNIGWGIQFQHPWFLTFMSILVIIFTCNMWGFFEIQLPQFVNRYIGKSIKSDTLLGNFAQGALATLLSTPCSAPFLGTAVGFSLSKGPIEISLVFLALGIGLATPYFILTLFPALIIFLPKPGPWILHLKKILGFSLLATAVWLLSILIKVTSLYFTLIVGVSLIAVIAVLYFISKFPKLNRPLIIVNCLIIIVTFWLPGSLFPQKRDLSVRISTQKSVLDWQPLEPGILKSLQTSNQIVFVDVTADWCITCKLNKSLVINQQSVINEFRDKKVALLQADWTLPNKKIASFLASYGKYGIPFNIVYGPNSPNGIVLPELLTSKIILRALEAASSKT